MSTVLKLSPAVDNASILERIGFAASLAYVFLRFALLSDTVIALLGFNPLFPYLTAPIGLIAVLFSGGFRRSIQSGTGIFFCLYLVWLVVCIPFSVWKGGSVNTLTTAFEANFSMFFLIVGLVKNWTQARRMLYAVAAGGAVAVLTVRLYGQTVDGRYALSFGTLQNPNDLATHLLFALPLCAFVIFVSSRFSLGKLLFLLTSIGILVIVLRTGSRAGFLTLLAMSLFLFLRASVPVKFAVLIAAVIAIPIMLSMLPPEVLTRYQSIFNSEAGSDSSDDVASRQAEFARGSTLDRKQLLANSITTTLQNPLFGVGPGQFAVADADAAKQAQRRAGWQVTHNAYTQVSAEAGIPGLIFFLGALFGAFGLLWRTCKRTRPYPQLKHLSTGSYCLLLAGLGLSIDIFFSAIAYGFYIPTLVGLAMALASIAATEVERLQAKHPLRASAA